MCIIKVRIFQLTGVITSEFKIRFVSYLFKFMRLILNVVTFTLVLLAAPDSSPSACRTTIMYE